MKSAEYPLQEWWKSQVAFLFAYDGEVSSFGPGLKHHLAATAWLVRTGWAQVTMREDGQVVRAEPGEWLMVRPGLRVQEFAPDTHMLSVNFLASLDMGDPFFREGLSLVLSAKKHPALERQGLRLLRVARLVLQADPRRVRSQETLSIKEYLRLQSALLDWVRVWSDALESAGLRQHRSNIRDPRAVQALEGMRKHVGDPDYDPHTLAATVGLSPSQLNRIFLRELGKTVRQLHQEQRIEYARTLLMREDLSLKEVAMELGFKHQSNFTTWFRKLHHLTPTEYRSLDPKKVIFSGAIP